MKFGYILELQNVEQIVAEVVVGIVPEVVAGLSLCDRRVPSNEETVQGVRRRWNTDGVTRTHNFRSQHGAGCAVIRLCLKVLPIAQQIQPARV